MEIKLMSKKFCIITTIIFVTFLPIFEFINLLTTTIDFFSIREFFVEIILSAPSIMIWASIFVYSPSKIIVKDDTLVAERFILKSIIIPVVDISKIRPNGLGLKTQGPKASRRDLYVIEYSDKRMLLNPIIFSFARIDFDKTIEDLQCIVDNAKKLQQQAFDDTSKL